MDDRTSVLLNLKQLIELDQAAGIEFIVREPTAVNTTPAPASLPTPVPAKAPVIARAPVAPTPALKPIPKLIEPVVSTALATTDTLASIAQEIAACKACRLCDGRRHTVPGEGNSTPILLFVGEGPDAEEDAQGRPFVGEAGQLLDKMITAMGLSRDQVFLTNIIKCRTPGHRTPEAEEINSCLSFIKRQIAVLKPSVICTLGNAPLRALTGNDKAGITRMRGQRLSYHGITMIPTFDPSFLLRNPDAKKPCWEDLQTVLKVMGREPPKRG